MNKLSTADDVSDAQEATDLSLAISEAGHLKYMLHHFSKFYGTRFSTKLTNDEILFVLHEISEHLLGRVIQIGENDIWPLPLVGKDLKPIKQFQAAIIAQGKKLLLADQMKEAQDDAIA